MTQNLICTKESICWKNSRWNFNKLSYLIELKINNDNVPITTMNIETHSNQGKKDARTQLN